MRFDVPFRRDAATGLSAAGRPRSAGPAGETDPDAGLELLPRLALRVAVALAVLKYLVDTWPW